MKRQKLLTTLLLPATLISLSASAQETKGLSLQDQDALIQLYKSCDQTLSTCDLDLYSKQEYIKNQAQAISDRDQEISRLQGESNGFSKLLWFAAGALATGLAIHLAR